MKRGYEKHGMSKTPEYISWYKMKSRCNNKNDYNYDNYGGRGVSICDKWFNSFDNFFKDMGYRPKGMTLDRIDVNGDYTPENCRWADFSTQIKNQRLRKDNSTGYKGVAFCNSRNKYRARINTKSLGYFESIEEAIKARKEAEIKYWK